MDNRFYFGFNTSEERKKRRKAELYSMSEQVSTFFWMKPRSMDWKRVRGSRICPLRLWTPHK